MKPTKRILIAEDSTQWQRFHKSLLDNYDKFSIDAVFASSAREALEIVEFYPEQTYDLVLSDLQMESDFLPDFAGEWFVKNLKNIKKYKNTPIVIVSAAYNISFIATNLGVGHLSKRTLVNNPDTYYFMLDEKLSV